MRRAPFLGRCSLLDTTLIDFGSIPVGDNNPWSWRPRARLPGACGQLEHVCSGLDQSNQPQYLPSDAIVQIVRIKKLTNYHDVKNKLALGHVARDLGGRARMKETCTARRVVFWLRDGNAEDGKKNNAR